MHCQPHRYTFIHTYPHNTPLCHQNYTCIHTYIYTQHTFMSPKLYMHTYIHIHTKHIQVTKIVDEYESVRKECTFNLTDTLNKRSADTQNPAWLSECPRFNTRLSALYGEIALNSREFIEIYLGEKQRYASPIAFLGFPIDTNAALRMLRYVKSFIVHTYMYICMCIYIYIYIYVCICAHLYVHIHAHIHAQVHTFMHA
jgi:hypothetical protein